MAQTKTTSEGYLLSPPQTRVWHLRKILSGNLRNNFVLKLRGDLDAPKLAQVWAKIVRRQESLRSEFQFSSELSVPLQFINAGEDFAWRDIQLSPEADWAALICGELDKNVGQGEKPLIISARKSDDEFWLGISLSALVGDVETANVLAKEILDGITNETHEVISAVHLAALQNEFLADEENASARSFWLDEISAARSAAPILAAKNAEPHFENLEIESFDLTALKRNLELVSEKSEIETKDIFLTAWAATAARFTNEDAATIFTETDGRIYGELENLIVRAARRLPLNFKIEPTISVANLLEKVGAKLEESESYQENFDAAQLTDRTFSFGFAFHRLGKYAQVNHAAEVIAASENFYEANLNLRVVETTEKIYAEFAFDREFLAEPLAMEMFRSFVFVLEQICENPQIAVSGIDFLSRADEQFLLENENRTRRDFVFKSLPQMFDESAMRNENLPAISGEEETLTFAGFARKVNKLSTFLLENGARKDQVVAILLPHGADALAAMLAVSKIGAAYLPLEISMPIERLEYVLADSEARILLTESGLTDHLTAENLRVLTIDDRAAEIDAATGNFAQIEIEPQRTAYVIYTSGSTGKPKGVAVTHEGLSNYLEWAREFYLGNAVSGAPLHSSIAFDMAVTSCFVSLLNGKSVHLTPETTAENPASLLEVWRHENSFDFVKLTPAYARLLGANLEESEAGKAGTLILGGEVLNASDIEFFRQNAPETLIVNEYGPTETVVGCAVFADVAKNLESGNIAIGKPIANTQIYLLDEQMRQVPRGAVGEIYIGGKGLANGYLHKPAQTAEKFVPNPFASGGARLYRTGDLAVRGADGNLIFRGRNDSQVKVRGFRVEPAEIEAALLEIETVAQSAVIVKAGAENIQNLHAFVVLKDENKIASSEILQEILAQKLPAPMIPATITTLEFLPLNLNGKIDRRRLSEILENQSENRYVAPRTLEEEILAGIWSQVLGVVPIGIDDAYTSLGGDSIRSLQIISRAQDKGLKISVANLLRLQTIRRVAAEIKPENRQAEETEKVERIAFSLVSKTDKTKLQSEFADAYPLSRLQAGMVFHRELNPESAIYHDVFGYHVKAPLDVEKLCAAIGKLIERHPVLRTSFDLANYETPLQIVHRRAAAPFVVEDISDLETSEQEKVLEAFLAAEKKRDFDIDNPPLLRFHVHIRSEDTFQFWLSFHHSIIDGWTDISMLVELALSYQELLNGKEISAQSPRAFYRDFIELELAELASEESRGFWERQLKDAPVMELPREITPSVELPKERGSLLVPIEIAPEISDRLRELGQANAVPIKNVLLAAHQFVMGFLSGSDDVVTTLTAVGRPETIDGDKVFGLHLNSMPFRQKLLGGTWSGLVTNAFEIEREALPYRRFPMGEIQRMNGGIAPAETLFYFTHYYNALDLAAFPEMQVFDWYGYEETSFALSAHFSVEPSTGRVSGRLDADQTQLSKAQVRKFADYYERTLTEMATNPHHRYDLFAPFDKAEEELLNDFARSETRASSDDKDFAPQWILEKADSTPGAIALLFGETRMTYGELAEKTRRLAQTLANYGIGAESVVAVELDRSPEMIVSILATMQAGAAYLPIDPNYPPERKSFMLADSRAELLITSELFGNAEQRKIKCLCVEDETILGANASQLPTKSEPENAAYMIYTSGSTGQPKGVIVPHDALANHILWAHKFYDLTAADCVLQFAAVGFDVLAEETFPTLAAGARLILWSEKRAGGAKSFFEFVEREKISIVNLPAAYWHEFVGEIKNNPITIPDCLRQIIVGSDTVAPEKLKIWRKLFPEKPTLNNSYGLTETTITSTVFEIEKDENLKTMDAVPIGKPVDNAEVYVLDAQLRPVPVGVTGEIYIGGGCLARGYFNQPALTAERFVPNPFSAGSARLYRTGDLAARRSDGNLVFRGRADDQIKLRGFRIEAAEIENALLEHKKVDSAVVVVSSSDGEEKSLSAFIETASNELDLSELQKHLRRKLPEYMIPSNFRLTEKLPRDANGKIDRKTLRLIRFDSKEIDKGHVEPRDDAEFVLAKICAEVLEKEHVGVETNFFELGGHSLLAVRFTARIRSFFQVELPLSALYENPTVEGIGKVLANEFGGPEKLNEVAAIVRQVWEMSEVEAADLLNGKLKGL